MRTSVIILFFALIFGNIFSQEKVFQKIISWQSNTKLQNGFEKLNFPHANFPDTITKFPYFSEQFEDKNNLIVSVSNIIYERIDSVSVSKIFQSNLIPDTFIIKQSYGSSQKNNLLSMQILPIYRDKNSHFVFRILSFTLTLKYEPQGNSMLYKQSNAKHSVLSSGKWYKIRIKQDGVYKLSYSDLKKMGFSTPGNVRVFGNGGGMLPKRVNDYRIDDLRENSIEVSSGNDGILFYGQGPNVWSFDSVNHIFKHTQNKFTDYSYYFITDLAGGSKKIQSAAVPNNGNIINVNTFDDYAYHESDDINLFKSGAEWYGDHLVDGATYPWSAIFSNTDTSVQGKFYYDVIARSSNNSYFSFSVAGKTFNSPYIGTVVVGSTQGLYASDVNKIVSFNPNSDVFSASVSYNNSNDPISSGYINYIGVNLRRKLSLKINSQQMLFRDKNSVGKGNIANFSFSDLSSSFEIWDITDVCEPKLAAQLSGTTNSFSASTDSLKQYIIFNSSSGFLTPETSGADLGLMANQDIHGTPNPQLVIIAPTDTGILAQAQRLAQWHRIQDKFSVLCVNISQVYNEFSSGKKDVAAIRDMMKLFYERSTSESDYPKYLLLFGDGSFANKISNEHNTNLLPTYESAESLDQDNSYVSDDFFGWMNDNKNDADNLLDIGVGRLPVKDSTEARIVVDKITSYYKPSSFGEWRNKVTFIADDGSSYGGDTSFEYQTETECDMISNSNPNLIVQKIYLDSYPMVKTSLGNGFPDANVTINNAIEKGTLLINYTGHSNENQLSHAVIIDQSSIQTWQNKNKYFVFFTASCEFSRFDNADLQNWTDATSAGENIFLREEAGGIALFSTTRLVYGDANFDLNMAFYNYIFAKDNNNNYLRLGDVMLHSKNSIVNGVLSKTNKLNFTLLGDPALLLDNPKDTAVITDSINNKPVNSKDTLNALSFVHVTGHLQNKNKFKGVIGISVFDKEYNRTTLGNQVNVPFTYKTRDNILFKGQAKLENSHFKFDFPIPKDIQFNFGAGKIVYYATDSADDAAGYSTNFVIGGIKDTTIEDNLGPLIKPYMNDTNFIDGGITSPNPTLYIKLYDANGINATGNSIGHDISAILDNDIADMVVLNDFYQADMDRYQSGVATYPYSGLSLGDHSISVTAWDIYNNSATSEIKFKVVENDKMILSNISNYPNPFTTETNFVFDFNLPNQTTDIEIRIFSITGQLVYIIKESGVPTGFRISPIAWNGIDYSGKRLSAGIYLYKINVRSTDGTQASGYGKVAIAR